MDGRMDTFFDAPDPGNGAWVGLDLGVGISSRVVSLRYSPRSSWAGRMIGGAFQGANTADFADALTLYVITSAPPEGVMTSQTISATNAFRYVRYLSPDGGYGNISEVEFYGPDGTPGLPVAPANLRATAGDARVDLAWTPSSGAMIYNVKVATVAPAGPYQLLVAGITGTNYSDLTVSNGVVYYYRVSGVNTNGEGASSPVASALPQAPQYFGVYRELWTGLNTSQGNTLAMLTNTALNPNWPDRPDAAYTRVLTNFETEINMLDAYGQRVRGFIVPPTNGSYTFWISSDDASALFLSTDETPANARWIAGVASWTNPREWTREGGQQSTPITLEAGRRYYLEAQMQEGGGGDNLAVRWQLPDGTLEEPLMAASPMGTRLVPFNGANTAPVIQRPPASVTVVEGGTATFSVLAVNPSPVTYQWRLNGLDLPDAAARQPSYVIGNAMIPMTGRSYSCLVSNEVSVVVTAPATLTVLPDSTPPTLVRAFNIGQTNVQLTFSEPVEPVSATNLANYVFTNGLVITRATLASNGTTVTLTTVALTYGSNYVLLVSGVRDRASAPNPITSNTPVAFTALPFAAEDIGRPPIPGVVTVRSNGLDVAATGGDIGGNSDQFSFNYQLRSGDFDLAVRLEGLTPTDAFAKAGLIARETLDASARFAAALATPAMSGSFFEWRDPAASPAGVSGAFPVNYPATWLRLRRAGNTFTGYASYDGQIWSALASTTIAMPAQICVGLAVASHHTTATTTARFRELAEPASAPVLGTVVPPFEPLGVCSRKTPIVISEIMFKPAPRADTNNVEFIEIYNTNPFFHDISGYRLAGDISYTFPPGTILPGGGFAVIAASPTGMASAYGLAGVFGPYSGSLKKSGTVKLLDEIGAVLLKVNYDSAPPWPAATGGAGHSLVLARPSFGEADPRAWAISDIIGGSPGEMEAFRPSPLRSVVINEFLAHTDLPATDYVELYNHANQAVDLSGCVLTDDAATNKFVIPVGTIIPARGFLAWTEAQLMFSLSAAGETIYFKNPTQTRVLDAVSFGGQENGVATGRWPDGADAWHRLAAPTFGTNNAALRVSQVGLNELMYHPISGNDDDQFVELYNRGTNAMSLSGWRLEGGVSYSFPSNTVLGADGYLVVARNAARLRTNYPNLNLTNCLGDYSGQLAHRSERVVLTMPDQIVSTNASGLVSTNTIHIAVDEVTYGTGGRWGQWSDGGGSSLELVDARANHRLAANWADSDETQKAAWTTIEATGVLDNGSNYDPSIGYAQLGLLDPGECLVDEVEVRAGTNGANLVLNPTFEGGLGNWSCQGSHVRSGVTDSGYLSSRALKIRASDGVWTGVNSCQLALAANTLSAGQTATLRFRGRWLRGCPEALLRLNGNWLEATGALPVPANLGTPGARNSRAVTNAGPAIFEVTHSPVIPQANQPVVVTARVHDPDGVGVLFLYYRLDPAVAYTVVPMRDDGTGGDAIASDGWFSGTIPAQNSGATVAFYLSARDSRLVTTRFPALMDDNAPVRECVIRFGDPIPGGAFPDFHVWISQTNVTRWSELPNLSNESHDCTIATRSRVIYNAQARFAGSPYHQGFNTPDGNYCHYKWTFPEDDQLFGATSFNKIHQPGNGAGDDGTLQREQLANTFLRTLGVPWLNRRHVVVYVNGSRRGWLMEDAQTPNSDVVEQYFPDDPDGWLYKMQPWFEFAPFPSGAYIGFNNAAWCDIMPHTTTGGVKKTARYRYNFLVRRTAGSASTYTNVFTLVDAASAYGSPGYAANMENLADMENWMRVFAANHAAGNWDSFGAQNAQNLYGYSGPQGTRYSLMMFDFNIVFGNGSWGPGDALFAVNGADPNTANIYNEPTFRRMYWRALQELVDGPLNVANSGPLLDAKYQAFLGSGVQPETPANLKSWLTSARSSIASQLASENATSFAVNSTVQISNNLAWVSGVAPVRVKTVTVNGVAWPVTWTSVTAWRIAVPMQPGTNFFSVVGLDRSGQPVAGAAGTTSAILNTPVESPLGRIVINEINFAPTVAGSEFVELFNSSSNVSYDLSGCEFRGLGYTFPSGSLIGPGRFLTLAANRSSFAAAYGATTPLFAAFDGALQTDGETLTLLRAGTNGMPDTVIAKVKYGSAPPWPGMAPGSGRSLQLVDPRQDNWRVGNWAVAASSTPAQWVYVTATGNATASRLYLYLGSPGDIYLDDLMLVAGSAAGVGANLVANGDFESPLAGSWTMTDNFTQSALSTQIKRSGASSLHMIATQAGSGSGNAIFQDVSPGLTAGQTYTVSFWYRPTTNGTPLVVRLSGSGVAAQVDPTPPPAPSAQSPATPSATNSVLATIAAFPPLWINELQATNLTGLTNRAGQHAPWLELYNPSTNTVALSGLCLSGNLTNLEAWTFPTGAVINPGQFKVIFADGQTNLSTLAELHTNFRLTPGAGAVALSRVTNGAVQVLDFLSYTNLATDRSFGSFPDGQWFERRDFFYATPASTNNPAGPPLPVLINEWMADNATTLADPADGDYEDWFELYNAGTNTVDLGNCFLSDTLTNTTQSQVPNNGHYRIPPGGWLLVWADGEAKQNSTNRADLHASFKLDKAGEAIVLSDPTGKVLDYVAFGVQVTDQSQGRYPDGGLAVAFSPWPTPRGANATPNTAPTLPVITDKFVYPGQTLNFFANATDADLPPQVLTYSLDPGAPAGASIGGTTGLFTWAVPVGQGTGQWPVTLRVTDSGIPPLSAAHSFFITVVAAPMLSPVTLDGSTLTLSCTTVPGQRYRLEAKDDLRDTGWLPASSDVVGTGAPIAFELQVTAAPQRFYRITASQERPQGWAAKSGSTAPSHHRLGY